MRERGTRDREREREGGRWEERERESEERLKAAEGGETGFSLEKMVPSAIERHRGRGRMRGELGSLFPHLIGPLCPIRSF